MFHHDIKHREELKIRRVAVIFDELRGVWKCGQTLFEYRLCRTKNNEEIENKIVKIYDCLVQISKHRRSHDRLCLNLRNY